jgi:hypothetical protein
VIINNYLDVHSATGDIPDSTIRKMQEQFYEMSLDRPGRSILPS